MNILLQEGKTPAQLDPEEWDFCFSGKAIDQRGIEAINFSKTRSRGILEVAYSPDALSIQIGTNSCLVEEIDSLINFYSDKAILLETTTLGFVEIFICSRALRNAGAKKISLLYVEPGEYASPERNNLVRKREFDLSDEVPGFKGIPGATLIPSLRTTQRSVYFLGYEERRLDVAIESQTASPSDTAVVFGVPAFTPGWEMNSFANNIRIIKDNGINGGVHFCGAENPAAAYSLLKEIYDSLGSNERLVVGPIGTKPNGIGAALFAAENPDVGLFYDHPKKSNSRSTNVASWHLYTVEF